MLFEQMTNFYKDYAHEPHHFKMLMQAYEDLYRDIYALADQYIDNTSFADSETYRMIPYQAARIDSAAYDVTALLSQQSIAVEFGLGDLSVLNRVNKWHEELSVRERIKILDRAGHLIQLSAFRDGNPSKRPFEIINFDLYNDRNVRLVRNVDYAFFNNRIYLFGDVARYASSRSLVLKDIAIDFQTPEFLMGKAVRVLPDPAITQNDYREITEAFIHAALGGPIVSNLSSALQTVMGAPDRAAIIDRVSANAHDLFYKELWDENKPDKLGRFDFLTMIPVETAYFEPERTKIIRSFVELIKPSYANLLMIPYMDIFEPYSMQFFNHDVQMLVERSFESSLWAVDTQKINVFHNPRECVFARERWRESFYDDECALDDRNINFDTPYADSVNHDTDKVYDLEETRRYWHDYAIDPRGCDSRHMTSAVELFLSPNHFEPVIVKQNDIMDLKNLTHYVHMAFEKNRVDILEGESRIDNRKLTYQLPEKVCEDLTDVTAFYDDTFHMDDHNIVFDKPKHTFEMRYDSLKQFDAASYDLMVETCSENLVRGQIELFLSPNHFEPEIVSFGDLLQMDGLLNDVSVTLTQPVYDIMTAEDSVVHSAEVTVPERIGHMSYNNPVLYDEYTFDAVNQTFDHKKDILSASFDTGYPYDYGRSLFDDEELQAFFDGPAFASHIEMHLIPNASL